MECRCGRRKGIGLVVVTRFLMTESAAGSEHQMQLLTSLRGRPRDREK